MKKKHLIINCILFFVLFIFACNSAYAVIVTGSVTKDDPDRPQYIPRMAPLENVEVLVEGTKNKTVTDSTGTFMFKNIKAGSYKVIVRKEGYEPQSKEVNVLGDVPIQVNFCLMPIGAKESQGIFGKSGIVIIAFASKEPTQNKPGDGGRFSTSYTNPTTSLDTLAALNAGADPFQMSGTPTLQHDSSINQIAGETSMHPNNIMIYDPNAEGPEKTKYIELQSSPFWLCYSPKNKMLYMADDSNRIMIYNAGEGEHKVIGSLSMGGIVSDLKLSGDGTRLYATVLGRKNPKLTVIDTMKNSIISEIEIETELVGNVTNMSLCIAPNGNRVFVAIGNNKGGEVIALDPSSQSVYSRCPLGIKPTDIAITPNGEKLYIPNKMSSNVSVLSAITLEVKSTIPVGIQPVKLAITPDGSKAFVTNNISGTVSAIDTSTDAVIGTINVGKRPIGIAVTPDGKKVIVTNNADANISVLDANTLTFIECSIPQIRSDPFGITVIP